MRGNHAGAAIEIFLIERSQRHHRRLAGHTGCIAKVIAVQDVVADDQHALLAERVEDGLKL
jgi:hypothetical protein